MEKRLLTHLSCPFCGGNIKVKKISHREPSELTYGLLSCGECNTDYPVVEGIPIMMPPEERLDVFAQTKKNGQFKKGISVQEICKALENAEIEKVKEELVYSIPYRKYFKLPKFTEMFGSVGKRAIRKIMRSSFFEPLWTRYAKNVLENDKTTAYEAMRVYYQAHEHFNYFFYKFGQPRFLTSLGLASIFNYSQKPILDLACGLGHLTYFLTQKYTGRMSIGVDRNFHELFLARKYIAPEGQYICAEADEKLPFPQNTFGDIICADAFTFFPEKVSCIRDLEEIITDNGTIILNRIGNKYVSPHQGHNIELTPNGYLSLFNSMPEIMIGEKTLLDQYLNKKKPNLAEGEEMNQLKGQKRLTIVASNNDEVFKDHGRFDEWPHSIGNLNINPLYKKTNSVNNGSKHFKFTFPSEWYEFEDSLWQTYAPEEVTIPKELLNSLDNGKRNPETDKFIDHFVMLGFPKNYM